MFSYSCLLKRGKKFRKPCFTGTQKSHNVNIKDKEQETKYNKTKINNEAKVVAGASLSR